MKVLAVFLWILISNAFLGLIATCLLVYTALWTNYYILPALYLLWFFWTRNWICRNNFSWKAMRELRMWKEYCSYFPIKLVKTTELDPNTNYIFACHPHGLFGLGPFGCFATEGANVKNIFPGLSMHFMIHSIPLMLPLREFLLSLGILSVEKSSFNNLLGTGAGKVAAVIPGGIQEILYTSISGDLKLNLKHRKGFVRMALKHGASLVPVISFGENESYDQITIKPGGILYQIRQAAKALFGLQFFIPCGKGNFGSEYGILPNANQITTVVGAPLKVNKLENPATQDVDKLHLKYTEALRELFEANKSLYGYGNRELTLL